MTALDVLAAEVAAELAGNDHRYAEVARRTVTTDTLATVDPAQREAAVTAYLTSARDQLAHAVQMTGPEAVAAIKAEIATAAEATRQLGLSKEIQQDAQEMVRRAEYALGKAIRTGQERGEIRTQGQRTPTRDTYTRVRNGKSETVQAEHGDTANYLRSPYDFAKPDELHGNGDNNIYALADGVSESDFEAALTDAKAEGNLSRANVVRKLKGAKSDRLEPWEKLARIRDLAPTGETSGQIAKELGVGEEYVRRVARQNNITITADEALRGTRRLRVDSNRIVNETVTTLDGLVTGINLINYDDLDVTQAGDWATSLSDSIRVLNRFVKQIKEMTQ